MSVKKLFVLGCSFSTGEETCDHELIKNYNNYKTDPEWMYRLDSNTQTPEFWKENANAHSDHMIDMHDNKIPEWAKRPDVNEWINESIKKEGRVFYDTEVERAYPSYWVHYCDKNAYSRILNDSTDYEVINGSRRGTGIIYQHLIYNMHRQIRVNNTQGFFWSSPGEWPNSYIPEKQFKGSWMQEAYYPALGIRSKWRYNEINYHDRLPDPTFRYDEAIDNSDVLIWQFTGEPRYALTLRDRMDIPMGSSLQTLFSWIDNQKYTNNNKQPATYLPGRKQIKEWYKYYHDPACDMAKAVGWMENVIKLREAKGLKTIMLCITPQFSKRFGIEPRNNEHTVSLGFNFDHKLSDKTIIDYNIRSAPKPDPNIEFGLAYQGFKEIKFEQEKYLAKWGHLSSEGHILVADKIKEQLEKWK
jgi:hypothetical protein